MSADRRRVKPSVKDAPEEQAPATRNRAVALTVGTLGVALAMSLALAFASARNTDQVTRNAESLHWINSVMGTTAVARVANAQAVFFAFDQSIEVASPEAAEAAIDEARRALEAVSAWTVQVPPDVDQLLVENADRFVAVGSVVLDLASSGQVDEALEANVDRLEPAFKLLETDLVTAQQGIRDRIADTQALAGRLATVTQIAVTLLIPLAALITYRRIIQRQVREHGLLADARLEAERALNRAKDEFIAGLSHEFRTPLTSIYGFSEVLIETGIVDPESTLELINLINVESAELSRMVEDLLTAARLESEALTIAPTSLDPATECEAVLGPMRRSGLDVTTDLASRPISADGLRLRQILRNLLSNAAKHGGDRIGVVGRVQGSFYVWSVVDDGGGVPASIADRLFDRFVHDGREALLAGSVGLGLNIARSLAEAMGGELAYTRQEGLTVFTFTTPLAQHVPDEHSPLVSGLGSR